VGNRVSGAGRAGISDTLALGLLCEGLGLGLPIIAAPFPNVALARHPAFVESVERLRRWGVRMLWKKDKYPLLQPRTELPIAPMFAWDEVLDELAALDRDDEQNAPPQSAPEHPR
jgi:hypothetical protein